LTEEQAAKLRQAAAALGQSVEEFAVTAIANAVQNSLTPVQPLPAGYHRLDSIFGIFKDSPELDALMEHIHEEQRKGIEQFRAEEAAEEAAEQAKAQQ
ncbi:MAG: hypothetical protein ACRYFS_01855, partial [Janthinobacterium lividum]